MELSFTGSNFKISKKDNRFKVKPQEVYDLFGIVFEIYSHSYELTYSSGAYA